MNIANVTMCDVFGVDFDAVDGVSDWESILHDAARAGGYTVLDDTFYEFDGGGGGTTGILVLAESHLSVHTWPEHDYAAFTIESCKSEEYSKKVVAAFLDRVDHDDYRTQVCHRVTDPSEAVEFRVRNVE